MVIVEHKTNKGVRCDNCRKIRRTAQIKAWDKNHPGEKLKATKKNQSKKRTMVADYKLNKGCNDCGYNAHSFVLQFDHVRGEKSFNVSEKESRSISSLLEEIEKCDVVCANCHAIRTWNRNQRFGGNYDR